MAKTHKSFDSALNNAIDDVLKDYKSAMKNAVKVAVEQAKEDFMSKAKTCLEEYYDNYDPTERYERTETLQYAFLPYTKLKYKNDKISGEVGVEYSPHVLSQFIEAQEPYIAEDGVKTYKHIGYYGSRKHQPVDTWWVIDNYLRGVHPYTNGGTTSETAVYYEIYDAVSPDKKMKTFIKEYGKTFDANVLSSLLEQVVNKIK